MNRIHALIMVLVVAVSDASWAREVTIAFVTQADGKSAALDTRQSVWKSPYGGWVVATWPFDLRVDETPILRYQTVDERLAQQLQATDTKAKPSGAADLLDEITGGKREKVKPEELTKRGAIARQSAVTVDVRPGRHLIQPFGIEFQISPDGALRSADTRIRIDSKDSRIEVLCHAVIFKTFSDRRSVEAPLRVSCGGATLLNGLEKLLAEFEQGDVASARLPSSKGFRRLTLFLPASQSGGSYEVNGVSFAIDAAGRAVMSNPADARCVDGREIQLVGPTPRTHVVSDPNEWRTMGVRWLGVKQAATITCGTESMVCGIGSGAASLRIPMAGERVLTQGNDRWTLPAPDSRWPHALLVYDAGDGAAWSIETGPLTRRPGSDWSCRITALTPQSRLPGSTLNVKLSVVSGIDQATRAREMTLHADGPGGFVGKLPEAVGLWRLTAADSVLAGQSLGMVFVGETSPVANVSFFTSNNRGLVRRGDTVDVLWSARRVNSDAIGTWKVKLKQRSNGGEHPRIPMAAEGQSGERQRSSSAASFDSVVGEIAVTRSGADRLADSGCLKLPTAGLAPGDYEVFVDGADTACYPLRLRVCQRGPVSDFELYSYVYNDAKPYGGSPVTAFYGSLPSGPGLEPFLADGDSSLDPALSSYGDAPQGPAFEKFLRPTSEESTLMALAGQGMRAVPAYPAMLHHEDWNPKHTLPEDLAQLRRRLALFVQPRADVAGLGGITLGWFAKRRGYWEESPQLDGHQQRRIEASDKAVKARVEQVVETYRRKGYTEEQLGRIAGWQSSRAFTSVLGDAWGEYLADVHEIWPGLTSHHAIPSFDQGGWESYAPTAYEKLTHRDAVDYTDYCLPPWGNFRAPAFLAMGNPKGQKLHCEFFTHEARSEQIPVAFGAVGRGLDGFSMTGAPQPLLRLFERLGPWFSSFEPLPDVAVYFADWPQRASVILHDLARMRRPGMLLAPEDVLAGKLAGHKVLFLAGLAGNEPPEILAAFREFEKQGGAIIKDAACVPTLPGHTLAFAYDNTQVHNGWGLAYPNGEWEFAHLWQNFKQTREKPLVEAFAKTRPIPVTTPDADVVISPLAGEESIICFVINQTLAPLEIEGRWRQMPVLPKTGELHVEQGWHVHDLLRGQPVKLADAERNAHVDIDLKRAEGAIYLLTKRVPRRVTLRSHRTGPHTLRVHGWLADAEWQPFVDPMPFEVTLRGADGAVLFRKFAALSENRALEVPVPAQADTARLELSVRDLVLGHIATQAIDAADPRMLAASDAPDLIGGAEQIQRFATRKGRVKIVLDESQGGYRRAAEMFAAKLKLAGRPTEIIVLDPAEVRPLALRWKPLAEDKHIVDSLVDGAAIAWRVGLTNVEKQEANRRSIDFEDPKSGYDEYGPRLRIDADVVLFGTPSSHRALHELAPFLRRVPTANYPAVDGYFLHYLWSPFQGGFNGLYVGCHDPAGAEAAAAEFAGQPADNAQSTEEPKTKRDPGGEGSPTVVTTVGKSSRPIDWLTGAFGTGIQDIGFAPNSERLFVTTDSYGDWLFALNSDGAIERGFAPDPPGGFPNWWRYARGLRPVDDRSVYLKQWNADYLFDIDRGLVSQAAPPTTGFTGGFSVKIAAATKLDDVERRRTFLGGLRKMRLLDAAGRVVWSFDDLSIRLGVDDLLYPRCLFPRAISVDGNVLLVAGFAIQHDTYNRGRAANASVMGFDAATGKLLWQRDGMLLNEGKVIPASAGFLLADDSGSMRLIAATSGEELSELPAVKDAAWMLAVPHRDELLIVENHRFDRGGPTSKVYLRPLSSGPDRPLEVAGRIRDVVVAGDGKSITLLTDRQRAIRFSTDGERLWDVEIPGGRLLRLVPGGERLLVGSDDGVLYWLDGATGERQRTVDFNSYNTIDASRLVAKHRLRHEMPVDVGVMVPPEAVEPSYLTSLAKTVKFGPNLVPTSLRGSVKLASDTSFTLRVEAGKTYLVEMVAAVAERERKTPHTRLDVTVHTKGASTTAVATPARVGILSAKSAKPSNLPFVGRLPLTAEPTRRRAAFRADATGEVTLSLCAVEPRASEDKQKRTELSYEAPVASAAGVEVTELAVVAMSLGGRNLVYDEGPQAKSRPIGGLTCLVPTAPSPPRPRLLASQTAYLHSSRPLYVHL
jgi:hypothetical protein